MTRELLIKGGYVVTVDPELGDLPDGDVFVRDDIIAAVGPALTVSAPEAVSSRRA
jgi:5-methylthioadenosine/S-adenosylhomocysteine deaminase